MGEVPREVRTVPTVDHAHEMSDVSIRPLALFLAGLAASLIVVGAICAWLFAAFERTAARADPKPPPLTQADGATPGPQLQVSERRDLALLRQREDRRLHGVEWVDKDRGIARIPIETAIALTAERGLPQWPAVEAAPPAQGDEAERTPLEPVAESPAGTAQPTPATPGASSRTPSHPARSHE